MRRTRIKICGLTQVEDVAVAVACGADALGFVFASSPRQVTADQAARLCAHVPPLVARVGVFVDEAPEIIEETVRVAGLTTVQFSGGESPEVCARASVPALKVLSVGTDFVWSSAEPYRGHAAALLLDTYVTGKAGGTAKTFAWNHLGEPPGWAPIFVAGGLNPENVGAAIAALGPFAVDVSSGVESSPGVKDAQRIAAFCAAVRRADQEERT
jgi:phosphoribosylanthranilate isomerase